jgi:hypothetical protein
MYVKKSSISAFIVGCEAMTSAERWLGGCEDSWASACAAFVGEAGVDGPEP